MKKSMLIVVMFMYASLAQADLYEARKSDGSLQFSDRNGPALDAERRAIDITHPLDAGDLPGVWEAMSANGHKTELTLRGNGSFVFDQTSDNSLHRVYMCGTWQGNEDALALVVKALKRQLDSGDIEQADGTHVEQATILFGQQDRMILQIQGEKLVFNRAG